MRFWVVASLLILLGGSGCAIFGTNENAEPNYAAQAEENLKLGKEALSSRSFTQAAKYFEHVRAKYPFLEISKEAELLIADTDFEREQFSEARERYEAFAKLHPSHPKVDYAAFRAALTHYKEIPSSLFVLPPGHEKDQVAIRLAASTMADYVRTHPNSEYVIEARTIEKDARKRLARHEQYVADFYTRGEHWNAVAGRLETLVTQYPGTDIDVDAYLQLHHAYEKLGDKAKAHDALERLVAHYPSSWQAARAQELLRSP